MYLIFQKPATKTKKTHGFAENVGNPSSESLLFFVKGLIFVQLRAAERQGASVYPSEVCIQGLSHLQVNDIAAGVTHSCAVTWHFLDKWWRRSF